MRLSRLSLQQLKLIYRYPGQTRTRIQLAALRLINHYWPNKTLHIKCAFGCGHCQLDIDKHSISLERFNIYSIALCLFSPMGLVGNLPLLHAICP
jgi:hypothetical protein